MSSVREVTIHCNVMKVIHLSKQNKDCPRFLLIKDKVVESLDLYDPQRMNRQLQCASSALSIFKIYKVWVEVDPDDDESLGTVHRIEATSKVWSKAKLNTWLRRTGYPPF